MPNIFEQDLERNPANHAPLTPLSYIERAAYVYPGATAIIHGEFRATWAEAYARCRRLASALSRLGIGAGDTVAVMLPNIPAMVDAHFGIAMTGA
ncbi:MAG: AMP-binding protein, partial [Burkholderiales bacterium]|nr:AMP-binding protein [Burkholderiales bacterium]